MKKNILLIFMFITLFFVGNNEVLAKKCEVGENGCLEQIENADKNNDDLILTCLYEVEIETGLLNNKTKKYYNYIFYSKNSKEFKTGSTITDQQSLELKSFNHKTVFDLAYNSFKNYECPKYSYLDTNSTDEICYDNNNEECYHGGKSLNNGTNFNKTVSSTLKDYNKMTEIKKGNEEHIDVSLSDYSKEELDFKESCSENNRLKQQYGNMCRYLNEHTGDHVLLYYNNVETFAVFGVDDKRFGLYGEGKTYDYMEDKDIEITNRYYNGIKTINSCPKNLALYTYSGKGSELEEGGSKSYKLNYYAIYKTKEDVKPIDNITKAIYMDEIVETTAYNLKLYNCSNSGASTPDPGPDINCYIFGDKLIEIINGVLKIIRIAVPLLLLGLITYDFATATFAGADDKMKKAQSRAIKRVIIAIIIFFVPTLVNFVFDIANEVWVNANFEICGINEE